MQQIKTVLLAEVINVTNKIFKFFKYYVATVLLAVAFFTHFFLPHPEYEYKKTKDEVIKHQDNINDSRVKIIELAKQLNQDKITLSYFNAEVEMLVGYENTENQLLETASIQFEKVREKNKAKYFGFPSLHKFMWSFGLAIIVTVLSLRIMYYSHTIKEDNRRNANASLGLIGGLIGGYLFAWIFYPASDLPAKYYLALLVIIGAIASVLGFFLSKSGYANRMVLKAKIRYLMDLMIVKTTNKDLVKDIEVYTIEIVEPALNKLDE